MFLKPFHARGLGEGKAPWPTGTFHAEMKAYIVIAGCHIVTLNNCNPDQIFSVNLWCYAGVHAPVCFSTGIESSDLIILRSALFYIFLVLA